MSALGRSRHLHVLVVAVLVATGSLALPARAQEVRAAAPDLTIVTDATYEVQPEKHRVEVTVDMVLTNHLKDTATRRYYFDHAFIAVLPDSSDHVLTWSGKGKPGVTVSKKTDKYTVLDLKLADRIYSGKTAKYRLRFSLVDRGGTATREVRVGTALASFPVWAYATDSTPGSTVRVVFPKGFEAEVQSGDIPDPKSDDEGRLVFQTGKLDKPIDFFAYLVGDRAGAFADQAVTAQVGTDRVDVTIQAWPDDKTWSDRVSGLIRRGLPVLAARIGQPWPRDGGLTVKEAVGRSTGGYAGLFDAEAGEVEIAYFADDPVVLHESAHAWFNGSLLADRWANEAFASYYGFEAAADLGVEGKPDELTSELEAVKFPLNDWGPIGREDDKKEDYAYAASLVLARAIAERAGDENLKAVWADASAHVAAYQPPAAGADAAAPAPETVDGPPDWRGLLDLLDGHSGKSFEDLWRTWVTRPSDEPLLDARRAARAQYDAVVAQAADWRLPRPVRDAMRAWRFDEASALLRDASTVLTARGAVEAAAAKSGLTVPATLRTAFETPGGFAAATQEATAEQAAIDRYDAAVASRIATPDALQTLGLWDTTPDARLAEARDAFAAGDLTRSVEAAGAASAIWFSAEEIGRSRAISIGAGALAILLALILLVAMIRAFRRRRRARRAMAAGAGAGAAAVAFGPEMLGPESGLGPDQAFGDGWTAADAAAAGVAPAAVDPEVRGNVAEPGIPWTPVDTEVSPPPPIDATASPDQPLGRIDATPGPDEPLAPDADATTERVSTGDAYATLAATSAPPEAQPGDEAQPGAVSD